MIRKFLSLTATFFIVLVTYCYNVSADQLKNIYDSKGNIIRQEVIIDTGPLPAQTGSVSTGSSSRGPVITYPQGSSGYWCSEVVGYTFEDLMTHGREAYEAKNWTRARYCSKCAYYELRPSNVEAIILYFKSAYYYEMQKGKSRDKVIETTIYHHLDNIINKMPNPTLKAYRNWVVNGGEPDNFKIVTKRQIPTYFITLKNVNVRSGPSIQAEKLGTLKEGFRVKVFEMRSKWARIGEDKWVYKKYLLELTE